MDARPGKIFEKTAVGQALATERNTVVWLHYDKAQVGSTGKRECTKWRQFDTNMVRFEEMNRAILGFTPIEKVVSTLTTTQGRNEMKMRSLDHHTAVPRGRVDLPHMHLYPCITFTIDVAGLKIML